MSDEKNLSITYSSGLIPPPELMSTLAVFYDEIWLPCRLNLDIVLNGLNSSQRKLSLSFFKKVEKRLTIFDANWNALYRNNSLIVISPSTYPGFQELSHNTQGAIPSYIFKSINEQLIKLKDEINNLPKKIQLEHINAQYIESMLEILRNNEIAGNNIMEQSIESIFIAMHLLMPSKPAPEIYISNIADSQTSSLSTLLAQKMFTYIVPQIQVLNAEQILEVRDYLKDTKEGLAYYINEMTDDVERRIREGNLSDIEAAQRTFERKIQPQYEEFRRKLLAKKTGFWSKVAVAGGKFMQVDAAPWTPKFWGAVIEMFGVSLDALTKDDQENLLSNKSQAFNYIATLENRVSKMS